MRIESVKDTLINVMDDFTPAVGASSKEGGEETIVQRTTDLELNTRLLERNVETQVMSNSCTNHEVMEEVDDLDFLDSNTNKECLDDQDDSSCDSCEEVDEKKPKASTR